MPSFCAVINCNDRYGHSENISFHKFPLKRIDLLKQWEAFIQTQRGPDWHASRWSSLCSRHFREDDFRSLNERKTLKKTAVPSIMVTTDVYGKSIKYPAECQHAHNRRKNEVLNKQRNTKQQTKRLEDHSNAVKSHCRLCGVHSVPADTFHSNYKLLGDLRKCLPCMDVQGDDLLPKTICDICLKTLEQFSNFVDKVLETQAELQRKYRHRTAEKVLKIKQEPVVRVKQEISDIDNNQEKQHNDVGIINEDFECNGEQLPDTSDTSDQKYELCDFPIINDCDIMEIINLDDPFINIPDDDNTTSLHIESEHQDHTNRTQLADNNSLAQQHALSAHDLLQAHLLMEEHNYAYLETEQFKEEGCFYKTEKVESYEQNFEDHVVTNSVMPALCPEPEINCNTNNGTESKSQSILCSNNENRALKPIVTSVSAIQQPNKSNSIVVLDESIVKSSMEFQLHTCMVCQMKFFNIEALRQHYTQTHSTPMVSVPNINLGQVSSTNTCKMENEINEIDIPHPSTNIDNKNLLDSTNTAKTISSQVNQIITEQKTKSSLKNYHDKMKSETRLNLLKPVRKRFSCNLNVMASNYQQLKKLYHKLQKKCINLEQNVEQLQSQPKDQFRNVKKLTTDSYINKLSKSRPNRLPNDLKFECTKCLKVFSNANSLRQHKITHTEEKPHICGLCSRSFKRRNGLLQHFKGYHLQVKPFSCAVCKHSYALKCDMLRCKHSVLKNVSL